MPRERNEGTGDTEALNFNINYTTLKKVEINGTYGRIYLKSDLIFNKYTMPSYSQTNFNIKKNFRKFLKDFQSKYFTAENLHLTNHLQTQNKSSIK
jgi:hypothetical protein